MPTPSSTHATSPAHSPIRDSRKGTDTLPQIEHVVVLKVRDHTAILKLIEKKWNLPALTYRDANADDLLDCLDFRHPPAFLEPPMFPAPGSTTNPPSCTPGDPGTIPSPGSIDRI